MRPCIIKRYDPQGMMINQLFGANLLVALRSGHVQPRDRTDLDAAKHIFQDIGLIVWEEKLQ
jgi:hypothetical protein